MVLTEPTGSDLQAIALPPGRKPTDYGADRRQRFQSRPDAGEFLLTLARSEPDFSAVAGLSLFLKVRGPRIRVLTWSEPWYNGSPTCERSTTTRSKLIAAATRADTYVLA
jgi:hypothetical protein